MTTAHSEHDESDHVNVILKNRVPEITFIFWVIKVLSTTTGETFSDYFNVTLGWGLPKTTYMMMVIFFSALAVQFWTSRYNAFVYWFVVIMVSIFGTLVTDNLTDGLAVPLWISTIIFAFLLFISFGVWYWKERTLNFHTIVTRRREAFYWVAIIFTFALGTAAGDLITEEWGLGYWRGMVLFAGIIALDYAAWYFLKANGVTCFWIAYILTRPLGACTGDYLSQDKSDGGLGLGTTIVSLVFLAIILILVTYLQIMITRERQAVQTSIDEKGVEVDEKGVEEGNSEEP